MNAVGRGTTCAGPELWLAAPSASVKVSVLFVATMKFESTGAAASAMRIERPRECGLFELATVSVGGVTAAPAVALFMIW